MTLSDFKIDDWVIINFGSKPEINEIIGQDPADGLYLITFSNGIPCGDFYYTYYKRRAGLYASIPYYADAGNGQGKRGERRGPSGPHRRAYLSRPSNRDSGRKLYYAALCLSRDIVLSR